MLIAPAALVEGASRLPLPYGLFSVVSMRPSGDRWENGVLWEPGTTGELGGVPGQDCESPAEIDLGITANVEDAAEAAPFTVYGYYHGNPIATSFEVAQAKALDHLLSREEARVEKALWTGDLGNAPSLAGTAELLEVDDPYDYVEGIALLEQSIAADYGSLGVIHMTRQMAVIGLSLQALETRNGRLLTALGTPVVAGAGYDGSDPDGEAAPEGQSYVYVTPQLFGYRSDPFTSSGRPGDLLDRTTNTLYAIAERTYLLGFDTAVGVFATLMKME